MTFEIGEHTLGIDIDNWAFENAQENKKLNNCNRISFEIGDVSKIGNKKFENSHKNNLSKK